jgi:ferric-dicitrate binding protein FerR (iron transport regulator)
MDHHQTLETYSGTFYSNLRRKLWRGHWMWPAAIILFLLSFALWQWFGLRVVQIRTNGTSGAGVQLPDRSEVQLNVHSTLRYHKHFIDAAQREVWLNGDAVFQVVPHETVTGQAGAPFTVHTSALDVTVAGGNFNVTTKGRSARVRLNSGSTASIRFKHKKLADQVLHPGETLEYSNRGGPIVQKYSR